MKKINKYKKIFADGGGEVANAQRQSAMKDMTALLCDDISRITFSCISDFCYVTLFAKEIRRQINVRPFIQTLFEDTPSCLTIIMHSLLPDYIQNIAFIFAK